MTAYQRDFTIGLRETMDFYTFLTMRHWRKGFAGFGAAGALAGLLYAMAAALDPLWQAAAAAGGAVAGVCASVLVVAISTRYRVKGQVRRSGRERYVQETEINGFGVHVTVGKDKARLGFENLRRVAETRKAFYLFLSDSQGWILPKRQMEDPQGEAEQLRGIFRTVVERGKLELKG